MAVERCIRTVCLSNRLSQQKTPVGVEAMSSLDVEDVDDVLHRLALLHSRNATPRHIEDILAEADALVSKQNFPDCRKPVPVNFIPGNKRQKKTESRPRTTPRSAADAGDAAKDLDLLEYRRSNNLSDPVVSARQRSSADGDKRLISTLEQLKDATERLKCAQVQQETLTQDTKETKDKYYEQCAANKHLEARLVEKDNYLDRLKKELEHLRLESEKMVKNEWNLKQELRHLREDGKTLASQIDKDKAKMQDLQRQCKEMEAVLMKRHPDSVSALIVASKAPSLEAKSKKYLEMRIANLEKELKQQDDVNQNNLATVNSKVVSMKDKYEMHIADLEHQVVNLQKYNLQLKEKGSLNEVKECASQTDLMTACVAVQTAPAKTSSARNKGQTAVNVPMQLPNNVGTSDSHLLATVRGLNSEVTQKNKQIIKLSRELEEMKKMCVKIQKSKEASQEKLNPPKKPCKPVIVKQATIPNESPNPITNNNKENKTKSDDDTVIRKQLNNLQKDYTNLKKKRIDDLVELQTAHEKEIMNLNLKISPLHNNVESLNDTVNQLHQQIKVMDEKLTMIITERDHYRNKLETNNLRLNETVNVEAYPYFKDSIVPSESEYNSLKVKVAELERRYEGRELRLKTLIKSLSNVKDLHLDGSFSS